MKENFLLFALSLNSHYKHRLGFLGRLQHGARLNEVEEGGRKDMWNRFSKQVDVKGTGTKQGEGMEI